jgi:Flp pilus assembly protein TadG
MIKSLHSIVLQVAARTFALRHSAKGTVSVELAFFIPVAAAMITGAVEFGRLGLEQVRIASAARAGAQYGIYDLSSAGDIAGITNAVRLDADDVDNSLMVTATPNPIYRCSDGTVKLGNEVCSDGKYAPMYVEVQVTEAVDLWFGFPGVPSSITLTANSSMRVR